jgi:hypothetical protein
MECSLGPAPHDSSYQRSSTCITINECYFIYIYRTIHVPSPQPSIGCQITRTPKLLSFNSSTRLFQARLRSLNISSLTEKSSDGAGPEIHLRMFSTSSVFAASTMMSLNRDKRRIPSECNMRLELLLGRSSVSTCDQNEYGLSMHTPARRLTARMKSVPSKPA